MVRRTIGVLLRLAIVWLAMLAVVAMLSSFATFGSVELLGMSLAAFALAAFWAWRGSRAH